MSDDDAILSMLSEMRDLQREELAWRKGVAEDFMRLQRSAVRWQRAALTILSLVYLIGLYIWFNKMGLH